MTEESEVLKRDLCKAGTVESLKHYQESWDSLMPVLDKIESLGFNTVMVRTKNGNQVCHIYDYKLLKKAISYVSKDKLNSMYQCIVNFIEWYNDESNKQLNNQNNE